MRRAYIFPAILLGCLIVIWISTVAAVSMPSQELLSPMLTETAEINNPSQQEMLATTQDAPPSVTGQEEEICSLPTSYPQQVLQWCPMIEAAADETGIPPGLIAAVILQESGGDPFSYSGSGAVGLMQIMPRDGLAEAFMCINGPCFSSRPTIEELQVPDFNIFFGARMLAGLYTKHGSFREALFRYGPMDVGYHYADLVLKIWDNYQ